jgi:restriction system protein
MTNRGRELLTQIPGRITKRELLQFPEFRAFATAAKSTSGGDGATTTEQSDIANPAAESTPEDAIYKAEATIVSKLQEQLIEQITEQTPAFFERLVVDLIVAMGYGGNRGHVVERLRRSGDEGIDGIVNEDPLGLDVVYVQAKRYGAENTIGRERIQQFAGALVGQGASKGVFVTTSSFSRGAIEYAQRVPHRIILVDGKELSRLMVQYGVGVRTETTITIKRLDLDYFDDADV